MTAPAPDEARTIPAEWRRRQEEQALAYHFLGRCFYEAPRAEWLAAFAGDRLFEAWPFPSGDDRTAAGLVLLTEFCHGWNPAQLDALTWDFNRLFVGPGEMLAAPWESVYRSKTKLTFQESTLQVRELYERFGVRAPAVHREPDDHLGLELAFVATLSDLVAQDTAKDDADPANEMLRGPEGLPAGPPARLGARLPRACREARRDRLLPRRGASRLGVACGIGASVRRGTGGVMQCEPGARSETPRSTESREAPAWQCSGALPRATSTTSRRTRSPRRAGSRAGRRNRSAVPYRKPHVPRRRTLAARAPSPSRRVD